MKREGLVIVMDPPFGGLAEVLSASVKKIWAVWRQSRLEGKVISNLLDAIHVISDGNPYTVCLRCLFQFKSDCIRDEIFR